jgi:hypothetical protein
VKNDEGVNSLTILNHNIRADLGNNAELMELSLDTMYEDNDNGQFINMFIKEYEAHVSYRTKN